MKFTIITHVVHKLNGKNIYAYEPYVREMNLWLKYVDEVEIIAPFSNDDISSIESKYELKTEEQTGTLNTSINDKIRLIPIQSFDITSIKNGFKAIFKIPKILRIIYKAMYRSDHIHLRCPGNIGLLGGLVQVLFPKKPKTVKYAGNWAPKSKQPLSYRFQKWILSNTFLTKNARVLVYGEWPSQSKNIVPFFTASYSEKELEEQSVELSSYNKKNKINFLFVGALAKGKQPLLSVKVVHELKNKGYKVQLDMYGEGIERACIEQYIQQNDLSNFIILHGNVSKDIVKEAYKKAHFLLFISKSEGWPKVVTEAMFWGCLPISSNVSCIPYMLGNRSRGAIVNNEINEIISILEDYLEHNKKYDAQVKEAMRWSRQYTLEKFEEEIKKIVLSFKLIEEF